MSEILSAVLIVSLLNTEIPITLILDFTFALKKKKNSYSSPGRRNFRALWGGVKYCRICANFFLENQYPIETNRFN